MKNKTKQNKISANINTVTNKPKVVPVPRVYKGTKNETKFPDFVQLCKYTQKELKEILPRELLKAGYNVVSGNGYIYAKGTLPVLLTAHMDTVHTEKMKDFYEYVNTKGEHIISSPQGIGGDDRCGIYMILQIIKDFKPSILFCEDEEIGGLGSDKFCRTEFIKELSELNFLIELDRANGKDAVFYDCDNEEFTKFIEDNTGYEKAWGSFSDISNLAPVCGVAAVNLSCGYYHAHTLGEEVNVEEMLNTIETVKYLLQVESKQFKYIQRTRYEYYGYNYWDDYWYDRYSTYSTKNKKEEENLSCMLEIMFQDEENGICIKESIGSDINEAWVNFFKDYPTVCWNQVIDWEEYWY